MAEKKAIPSIFLNGENKSKAISPEQLTYFCFGVLSNPINERYRELFEGKHRLLDVIIHMQGKKPDNLDLKVCNGTKQVTHTLGIWKEIISMNLRYHISDPKSPDCNVVINVNSKTVKKEDSKLSAF